MVYASRAMNSSSKDVIVLLAFKNSISSDPLKLLSSWNSESHHCDWYGVECDKFSGRVSGLNITRTMASVSEDSLLYGTLEPAVGNLSELRVLSIPHNAFYGNVPVEIGKLQFLEILELQGNNFSGWIPDQIGNFKSLQVLNLSYNFLSGKIPRELIGFGRIRVIDLSYNKLNGGVNVDHGSKCESLVHLRLSGNFLIDKIPRAIGNCSNLRSLLLDGNIFEGEIPVEIGRISELRVLDVSRNSLTDRIPKELAKCRNLSYLVLTNLVDGEFNAFVGGIPEEVLLLPNLEILWAPRANLGGRLPDTWNETCKLQVLNLGQNYITGLIPERMSLCRNLTFLDLNSNILSGSVPFQLRIPCMVYFNVSHNSLFGLLPRFEKSSCANTNSMISYGEDINIFGKGNLENSHFEVVHDFSWNNFVGELPLFSFGDGFLLTDKKPSYRLLLNNNGFNASLPDELFSACTDLQDFAVNLSVNHISNGISKGFLLNCLQLTGFEAAFNQLSGSISPSIGGSQMLQRLDLRGNMFTGSLPSQLGNLKDLKWVLLGGNNLTGEIPIELGQLESLRNLDLSGNALRGSIPESLAHVTNLEVLLLDHNNLSGEIPSSFSDLVNLITLDVSYNNLSGHLPHLQHSSDCDSFKGNIYLQKCPAPSDGLPIPLKVHKRHNHVTKLKLFVISSVVSTVVILFILLVLVLVFVSRRRKFCRVASLRRKLVVTFTDVPTELNYDNVVRATGNFNIQNLIGTGGFGATYKAELVPGFIVAVKRLSIGRFQGIQQFDAEIRTLGRIRHKNLVTLIGYHMGESDMFLIYNYLAGGNLETFIHDPSDKNVEWPVIHKIALDIAQALTYLHYYCVPRIVHRDIKPSNILLDEDLNAYLSDFGLARLLEVSETHATTDVAGTFGYVAPEYATTCRVSDKADVYSFGVVLLELISGKKSLDPSFSEYGNGFNIVPWAKLLMKEGRSSELFSSEMWEVGPQENLLGMLRLASACTMESLSARPTMKQVTERLKQLSVS
ncbi:hypothetical protein GIB67_004155 [Kingdonia uniflora]|uniref:non-specific serine/threonine protein kinase n=1 Tax=Kingdonia uniflora TaxID=39325 RepID=A0A7J7NRN6_9MAGN|nr:hypothetical protein GIB67_004155 [Kingdonia uniflora]